MNCKPPKRQPGCHGHCQEYLEERAEYDKRKAIVDQQKAIDARLTAQRTEAVSKAQKKQGKVKWHEF